MRDSITRQGKVQTVVLSPAVIVSAIIEFHIEEGPQLLYFLYSFKHLQQQETSSQWVGFSLSKHFRHCFVYLRGYQVDFNFIYTGFLNPIALFHVANLIHELFHAVFKNQQLFLNSI